MPYPHELESWWLAAACRATGNAEPAIAFQRLEAAAARLSNHFTADRPASFRDYASDPVSLAAYGVLFFPQTFARVSLVIGECLAEGAFGKVGVHGSTPGLVITQNQNFSGNFVDKAPGNVPGKNAMPMQILDLGSGSGASTLAAAMMFPDRPLALHAVDHSPHALASLQQVFADCRLLWPAASLTTHARNIHADGLSGAFDLILASFVLNELFQEKDDHLAQLWILQQVRRLAPGGCLVLIEPAGLVTCGRLQRLRNRFACADDISIVAPCPHRLPCPLLNANCGFCHDVRSWRVPDSVNLINRNMFLSVHDLKYGLLVLRHATARAPQDATPDRPFRLVGPMNRDKGRLVTHGCCDDGTLRKIELMTRGLSRAQIAGLAAHERGDRLRMVNPRLLGDSRTWRVDALDPVRLN